MTTLRNSHPNPLIVDCSTETIQRASGALALIKQFAPDMRRTLPATLAEMLLLIEEANAAARQEVIRRIELRCPHRRH